MHAAAAALRDGAIAAIKGIGGYHLACRADDEQAVSRLRARKHREDRPFALMAASLADAETLARIGPTERALLEGVSARSSWHRAARTPRWLPRSRRAHPSWG